MTTDEILAKLQEIATDLEAALTAALDAEDETLAELRDIVRSSATPGYGMRRLSALIARLEDPA